MRPNQKELHSGGQLAERKNSPTHYQEKNMDKETPDLEQINEQSAPTWDLLRRDLAQSENQFLDDYELEEE